MVIVMDKVGSPDEDKRLIMREAAARAAHEANRAWCVAWGDSSQLAWEEAPQWARESAYLGVDGVLEGNTPEQSHQAWHSHKVTEGWVYGTVKDPERKRHPCLVPYYDLPQTQRAKDEIFCSVVLAIAKGFGYTPKR